MYFISLYTYVESVSVQVQAVACAFPPQQRTSDHLRLFSPSVDLKALTRMCLKWRGILSAPSGMQPSLSFSIWALSLSSSLTSFTLHWIPLSLPLRISLSQSTEVNGVCLGLVWECRFAALMGLKQSLLCRDYLWTSLCMCWAESEQPQWLSSSVSPVTYL